jgi:hypothetical protein
LVVGELNDLLPTELSVKCDFAFLQWLLNSCWLIQPFGIKYPPLVLQMTHSKSL